MNDRETLIAMLHRAGVLFNEREENGGPILEIGTRGPANRGYNQFYADFTFATDGSLVDVGVWQFYSRMTERILHWLYCAYCGLVNLKNDTTRRALRATCEWLED